MKTESKILTSIDSDEVSSTGYSKPGAKYILLSLFNKASVIEGVVNLALISLVVHWEREFYFNLAYWEDNITSRLFNKDVLLS